MGVINGDILEPGIAEPPRDIRTIEAEPPVVLLGPEPLVLVRIGVGDHQTPARFQRARHRRDGRGRIFSVVQEHIGEDGVDLAVAERQRGPIRPSSFERTSRKSRRNLLEHSIGYVDANDARTMLDGGFSEEPGPRPDIGDQGARAKVRRLYRRTPHTVAEELLAHRLPLRGDIVEVLTCI